MSLTQTARDKMAAADPRTEATLSFKTYMVGLGNRQSFERLLLEFAGRGTVTYRAVHKGFLENVYYDLKFTAPVWVLNVLISVLDEREN